jgi:phosphoribosylpyrophosphate synthetase
MITLNLINLEKSDIKYRISKFPDGQQQLQFEDTQIGLIKGYTNPNFDYQIIIKSRLNNFKDLELICCAVASLRELNIEKIHLYTPYFLGSRSDRKFEEGSNNYLKSVICPIINSLDFKSVTVMDPHSDVLEACLNNFNKINNFALVDDALSYIIGEGE